MIKLLRSIVPSMVEREKDAKMYQKAQSQTAVVEHNSNDIATYIEKVHGKKTEIIDPYLKKMESIKKLRKLLKIL